MRRPGHIEVEPGIRVFYESAGEGPTLVLLNELAYFTPLATSRRVVAIDSRGRLRSDRVDDLSKLSVENEAADIERVAAALGLERFALLGWSYLGYVAALYAARHPDRVSALVLVHPSPPYRDPAWPQPQMPPEIVSQLDELRASEIWKSDQAEVCRRVARLFATSRMGNTDAISRLPLERCEWENEGPINSWRVGRRVQSTMSDLRGELTRITAPTLVIHGDADAAIPLAGSEMYASGIARSQLVRLEGVGHYAPLEQPELFFETVERHLTAWSSPRGDA